MQTSNNDEIEGNPATDSRKSKIAIASDHAGFRLKEDLKKYLAEKGYEYEDFGANSEDSADYPDFAEKVAECILEKKFERGILICSTGIGMSIAANKFPGIRAAVCYDLETAKLSRHDNDSNVLALGGRKINPELAKMIVSIWLTTDFEAGGRHERRVDKIGHIEARFLK